MYDDMGKGETAKSRDAGDYAARGEDIANI